MSRGPIHICFYSNRCKWSEAFLKELSKTSYKQDFKFICVDESPTRPPLPPWLKKVPTLVIQGQPEPLVDAEVMNWLFIKKQMEGSRNPGQPPNQPQYQGRNGGGGGGGGGGGVLGRPQPAGNLGPGGGGGIGEPEPFSIMDNSATITSEIYSYLDQDTSAQGNGGQYASDRNNNFSYLQGYGTKEGSQMGGMDMIASVGQKSRKEALFDQQLQAYQDQRLKSVPNQIMRQ